MATSRICSIPDCGKPHIAIGLCSSHYQRTRKYGRIEPLPPIDRTCAADGCDRTRKARGYCNMHDQRMLKHGSLELPERRTVCIHDDCGRKPKVRGQCLMHWKREQRGGLTRAPTGARAQFIEAAIVSQTDACIFWPFGKAHKKPGGLNRPTIKINDKASPVSAYVCERVHGPRPANKHHAAHSCGNGHLGCINPHHLRWATVSENAADRVIHGTVPLGEKNALSKLTENDVRAIRADTRSAPKVAKEYGVCVKQVCNIRNRVHWRHVPDEPS